MNTRAQRPTRGHAPRDPARMSVDEVIYQDAYEAAIRNTATVSAPWYVVPANHKWFTRIVVASAIIETLASLQLRFPEVSNAQKREIVEARKALIKE
jgi:polyphosphate kinase 2 (PPK2 family)